MVEFAGWAMPMQYTSITAEHLATRAACGIADISHMGRLRFEGPGAEEFLAGLLTRRVGDLRLGQIRYSLVTNEQGGILDDVLVGYYHNEYGQPFYVVVVNASNHDKIVRWIDAHLPRQRAEARQNADDRAQQHPCKAVQDVQRLQDRGEALNERFHRGAVLLSASAGPARSLRGSMAHRHPAAAPCCRATG